MGHGNVFPFSKQSVKISYLTGTKISGLMKPESPTSIPDPFNLIQKWGAVNVRCFQIFQHCLDGKASFARSTWCINHCNFLDIIHPFFSTRISAGFFFAESTFRILPLLIPMVFRCCSSIWFHHPSALRCAPPYHSHSVFKIHGSISHIPEAKGNKKDTLRLAHDRLLSKTDFMRLDRMRLLSG